MALGLEASQATAVTLRAASRMAAVQLRERRRRPAPAPETTRQPLTPRRGRRLGVRTPVAVRRARCLPAARCRTAAGLLGRRPLARPMAPRCRPGARPTVRQAAVVVVARLGNGDVEAGRRRGLGGGRTDR